jgi:hypothetical protein
MKAFLDVNHASVLSVSSMNACTKSGPFHEHVYGNAIVHATRHITNSVANVSVGNFGTRGQKT